MYACTVARPHSFMRSPTSWMPRELAATCSRGATPSSQVRHHSGANTLPASACIQTPTACSNGGGTWALRSLRLSLRLRVPEMCAIWSTSLPGAWSSSVMPSVCNQQAAVAVKDAIVPWLVAVALPCGSWRMQAGSARMALAAEAHLEAPRAHELERDDGGALLDQPAAVGRHGPGRDAADVRMVAARRHEEPAALRPLGGRQAGRGRAPARRPGRTQCGPR